MIASRGSPARALSISLVALALSILVAAPSALGQSALDQYVPSAEPGGGQGQGQGAGESTGGSTAGSTAGSATGSDASSGGGSSNDPSGQAPLSAEGGGLPDATGTSGSGSDDGTDVPGTDFPLTPFVIAALAVFALVLGFALVRRRTRGPDQP